MMLQVHLPGIPECFPGSTWEDSVFLRHGGPGYGHRDCSPCLCSQCGSKIVSREVVCFPSASDNRSVRIKPWYNVKKPLKDVRENLPHINKK